MKTKLTLALLTLGSAATMLFAQDGPPPMEGGPDGPRPGGPRPVPPLVAALDANHDGVIDADEIANAAAALKKLDKNGDGKLTPDELRPARPEGAERPNGPRNDSRDRQFGGPGQEGRRPDGMNADGPRPKPPLVAALDANGDGEIDATEISNAPAALKSLDKNSDGKLTLDELRPPRPEGGMGGPGMENRQGGPGGPGGKRPRPDDQ